MKRTYQPIPRPARRVRSARAGLAKCRAEGRCRLCGRPVRVTRHHLVARSLGGDDVDANIVPLCGHGTVGCHGDVEARRLGARSRLRAQLHPDEVAYVVAKKGEAWLDRAYPSAA